MINIRSIPTGPLAVNTYIVWYGEAGEKHDCVVIDPANSHKVMNELERLGLNCTAILITHGHFDHIMGANELRGAASVKIYAYEEEQDVCENTHNNCSDQIGRLYTVKCNKYLPDGAEIDIEGIKCKLIATPGHTKGSCCFYFEDDKLLISGDTLFYGSVGRTDLPTGSMGTLVRSIKEKLMCLPDDVKVYPGHGDTTTIGFERENNPFI